MMLNNKKGSGVATVIILTVFIMISYFVFIQLWPIASPFLGAMDADPITTFFLFFVPFFLVISIPLMFIFGGMDL